MVLESLINPFNAEKHPRKMFFIGVLYSSLAIFLSTWIFYEQSSLVMVFLTTIACVPLIYNTIKFEEKKDLSLLPEKAVLKEHLKALSFLGYIFLGVVISCAFWYLVFPAKTSTNLFKVQIDTITQINSGVTGFSVQSFNLFSKILFNNLKVLIFCILFSFIYGVGAIFILTWNATVIGTAIGNTIRTELYKISNAAGFDAVAGYTKVLSYGILRYSFHGIPEILAYYFAGLAGGIISIAAIRHDFGTKKYEKIVLDSSVLLIISLGLLIVAAFIEVFVTPHMIYGFYG